MEGDIKFGVGTDNMVPLLCQTWKTTRNSSCKNIKSH